MISPDLPMATGVMRASLSRLSKFGGDEGAVSSGDEPARVLELLGGHGEHDGGGDATAVREQPGTQHHQ